MNKFKIKATSNEYRLIISQEASLDEIGEYMSDFSIQLMNISREAESKVLIIETPNRILPIEVQEELTKLIKNRAQWEVFFDSNVLSKNQAVKWHKSTTLNVEFQSIKGGEIIEIDGDVLLIGNIEPGGYLRASGNIFIVGKIEGIVNAGFKGDKSAVIVGTFSDHCELRIDKSSYSITHLLDDKSAYIPRVYFLNDRQIIDCVDVNQIQNIRPNIDQVVSQLKNMEAKL